MEKKGLKKLHGHGKIASSFKKMSEVISPELKLQLEELETLVAERLNDIQSSQREANSKYSEERVWNEYLTEELKKNVLSAKAYEHHLDDNH